MDDPWCWSTDRLVSELCGSQTFWQNRSASSIPDLKAFEQVLRQQRVDGATFLELGPRELQDALSLTTLGPFFAVQGAIKVLRERSPRCNDLSAPQTAAYATPRHSSLSANWPSYSPTWPVNPPHPNPLALALQTQTPQITPLPPHAAHFALPGPSSDVGISPTFPSPLSEPLPKPNTASIDRSEPITRPDPIPKQGEQIIQSGGKKRRRLKLTTQNIVSSPQLTAQNIVSSPQLTAQNIVSSPPATVRPQSEADDNTVDLSTIDGPYLQREKHPIDEIFYGKRNYDDEISDESEDDFQLSFKKRALPQGLVQFVNRRVRHRLSRPATTLDPSTSIVYPYPERLVARTRHRSATLFKQSENGVSATKVDGSYGFSFRQHLEPDETQGDDSWDFLLSKYPPTTEDAGLPLYNDSGSENNFSEGLLDEMDQAEAFETQQREKNPLLKPNEVKEIVNESVQNFRSLWQSKKVSWRRRNEWPVWKDGHGRKAAVLAADANQTLERLNDRLKKLSQEIEDDSWTSKAQLENQCRSLQQTIYDQEELLWKFQVWKRPDEPQKVMKIVAKRPSRKIPRISNNQSESVGSGSDDMDDFVVDDKDVEMSSSGKSMDIDTSKSDVNDGEVLSSDKSTDMDISNSDVAPEISSDPMEDENLTRTHNEVSEDSVLGASPSSENSLPSPANFIDLTRESQDTSSSNEQPVVAGSEERFPAKPSNGPENWSWDLLETRIDHAGIIIKLLHSMDLRLRDRVDRIVLSGPSTRLKEQVWKALSAIKNGRKDISGVANDNLEPLFAISRVWVCSHAVRHKFYTEDIPPYVLDRALKAKPHLFEGFYRCMHKQSSSNVANPSDNDEGQTEKSSPWKTRKVKVVKSREAQALRTGLETKRVEGEARARKLKQKLNSDALFKRGNKIVVNDMKYEEEELIFLNDHIAQKIKNHQIDGLRFLWREVVHISRPTGDESDLDRAYRSHGCLLAHTMGLGKTMQTISLLVTIAEAAANPRTVAQVPRHLRKSQTLILCPPGLIENWIDELEYWLPLDCKAIGPIHTLSATDPKGSRIPTIRKWHSEGGVLILGLQIFRGFIVKRPEGTGDAGSISVSDMLLHGPNLVIVDEAHTLKNKNSALSEAASQFKTASRIALTGSPLANSLLDYHSMIDWVVPGFLGPTVEFKAYYQEPIEQGFSADAARYWRRSAMKKLQALKAEIEPIVDRKDVSAIANDMKGKTEFVIMLSLLSWQFRAYKDFVESLTKTDDQIVQTKLFDFINFLSLLCAHPNLFLQKLTGRVQMTSKDHQSPVRQSDSRPSSEEDLGEPLTISSTTLERQTHIQPHNQTVSSYLLSAKMIIIKEILNESHRLGDRVLIFSQHIPTINYLEDMLSNMSEITFFTLQGNTPPKERTRMVKEFNSGARDAFIISTRAGGIGLNISGANRVILVDFSFNPMHEEQAVGRAYRIGQQKHVYVYHLVTDGTFEKHLHDAVVFKKQLAARVVDKKNPISATNKNAQYLCEPSYPQREDMTPYFGKDVIMDKLLRDSGIRHYIRALKTAESMNVESNERLEPDELREVEQIRADYVQRPFPSQGLSTPVGAASVAQPGSGK